MEDESQPVNWYHEGRPVNWYHIYAREIMGETYYLCDDLEPIRSRAYGIRVHPVKESYEYVGSLQNHYGSTLGEFLRNPPTVAVESGSSRVVGGWGLDE